MNKGAPTNKLNNMVLKSIEQERLCDIDTTTSNINKIAMAKSRKCNLKQ